VRKRLTRMNMKEIKLIAGNYFSLTHKMNKYFNFRQLPGLLFQFCNIDLYFPTRILILYPKQEKG
jgi:hypothetical protein